jgi:hypothetical protein
VRPKVVLGVEVQVERKRHRGVQRRLESRNHYAALSWMGNLFSNLALAHRACLRSSGTDSSSRRKSAMRSIWWHLDAVAIAATMSCQDRSGLAFLSNMTRDNARESCGLPSTLTFSAEGSAVRLPVAMQTLQREPTSVGTLAHSARNQARTIISGPLRISSGRRNSGRQGTIYFCATYKG